MQPRLVASCSVSSEKRDEKVNLERQDEDLLEGRNEHGGQKGGCRSERL